MTSTWHTLRRLVATLTSGRKGASAARSGRAGSGGVRRTLLYAVQASALTALPLMSASVAWLTTCRQGLLVVRCKPTQAQWRAVVNDQQAERHIGRALQARPNASFLRRMSQLQAECPS